MICVVEKENFFFIISNTLTAVKRFQPDIVCPKKHKGTGGLCSQLVPWDDLVFDIISYSGFLVNAFEELAGAPLGGKQQRPVTKPAAGR